ncbi:MAG: hypothetical protein ACRELG_00305, partial [Gemmataceae bacterium]
MRRFGTLACIRMHFIQLFERAKFADETAFRSKKDQGQWGFPMAERFPRQTVAVVGELTQVVGGKRRADELLVDSPNHARLGEQTCSQIDAARSAG